MSLSRFIRPEETGRRIGLGFLALFLALPLVLFWISAVRGLEETDEAHYLLTALDPWLTGGRGLLFGFGLHPFWLLGGETVSGFRRVGILATLLATLPMAAAVWRTVRQQGLPVLLAWSVFPSLFLSSLVIFSDGIRTPSYNWLVFLGSLCLAGSAWQAAHQITNLAADPDGDGMNNRMEYALRRNPRRADRTEAWQSGWLRSNGVDFLTLTYRRPHDEFSEPPPGTDAIYDGFRYTVETSSNLVTWVAGSNEVAQTQMPDATGSMVTVTARIPTGSPRRFLRLRVEAP